MSARGKGKAGELEAAHLLADWWRPLEADIRFVRTPNSGGWATAQLRGEYAMAGDLMTKSRRWPFSVEVKRRESWNLSVLLEGKPSPVWAWWLQCCRAAAEEGKEPLLLFRKNRDPWLVGVGWRIAERLHSEGLARGQVAVAGRGLYVYRWIDFERVGPAWFEALVARRLATA